MLMERISAFNPERFLWCCEDFGLSPEDVAQALQISEASIAKIVGGELGPTFGQLRKIAKYFNRGVLFFIQHGAVDEENVRTPQFRSLSKQKPDLSPDVKKLIERAERQREVYLDLREDLKADPLPRFRPPETDANKPAEAASAVRRWLKLAERNSFVQTRKAIEDRGVMVLMGVGYYGDWRLPSESPIVGFSTYHERCPLILVKKQRNVGRQLFTLAHELGHLVMHRSSFIDDEDDLLATRGRERQANLFAGHLLVPDRFLENINTEGQPTDGQALYDRLKPWAGRWGVSVEMLILRLVENQKLARTDYDKYRTWLSALPLNDEDGGGSRSYRHREPLHLFGDRYVRTVLDAYRANQISLNKASGFLDNLKISDVHELERYVADV